MIFMLANEFPLHKWLSTVLMHLEVHYMMHHYRSDLDLICRQLSQHFTLCVPVNAEVFDL